MHILKTEKFQSMLIEHIQKQVVQSHMPSKPPELNVEWSMETQKITQSIYLTLSLQKVDVNPSKMIPSEEFLNDLDMCKNFEYLRVKHNFFKMLVRKYGFLYWQAPSFDKGSFVEIECEINFDKKVRFEEAWKQMKAMWKSHLWEFLQDFKACKERRISFNTLKALVNEVDCDGEGFRFFRRLKGVNGRHLNEPEFGKIKQMLEKPEHLIFVKSLNEVWTNNSEQFIFHLSPTKSGSKIENRGAQMSTITGIFFAFSN